MKDSIENQELIKDKETLTKKEIIELSMLNRRLYKYLIQKDFKIHSLELARGLADLAGI